MSIWTQQSHFKESITSYRKRERIKLGDIAKQIGVKESTLKDLLYRKGARPSVETARAMAILLGVSITEFIDDPNLEIDGIKLELFSADGRACAQSIIKHLADKELSDEDRQSLQEDFQRAKDRLKALKSKFK